MKFVVNPATRQRPDGVFWRRVLCSPEAVFLDGERRPTDPALLDQTHEIALATNENLRTAGGRVG